MVTVAAPAVKLAVFVASPFNVTELTGPPRLTVLIPPELSMVTVLPPAAAGPVAETVIVEVEAPVRSTALPPPPPLTVKLIVEP